jgi:hypothetical protein
VPTDVPQSVPKGAGITSPAIRKSRPKHFRLIGDGESDEQ